MSRTDHIIKVASSYCNKTEQIHHRAKICGECVFAIAAGTKKLTNKEMPLYKCGACNCDPTLDMKVSLTKNKCIKNYWNE